MLFEDFVKEFRVLCPPGAQFYNMTDAEELAIEILASPKVRVLPRALPLNSIRKDLILIHEFSYCRCR